MPFYRMSFYRMSFYRMPFYRMPFYRMLFYRIIPEIDILQMSFWRIQLRKMSLSWVSFCRLLRLPPKIKMPSSQKMPLMSRAKFSKGSFLFFAFQLFLETFFPPLSPGTEAARLKPSISSSSSDLSSVLPLLPTKYIFEFDVFCFFLSSSVSRGWIWTLKLMLMSLLFYHWASTAQGIGKTINMSFNTHWNILSILAN